MGGHVSLKSVYRRAVDRVQRALMPFFEEQGFGVRGRTFNRLTKDGLTQVVNIQMGPSDPPGTTYVQGLTQSMHGLFTVNLGVFVPEIAAIQIGEEPTTWVREYYCGIRSRLGSSGNDDIWWHARADDAVISDVLSCLSTDGIPFLNRYATRKKIMSELSNRPDQLGAASHPARIMLAILLVHSGNERRASKMLAEQAKWALEDNLRGHADYVGKLALRLGLGSLKLT